MSSEGTEQLDVETLRYSMVWEDHRLLERGLEVGPGDDVLSICSAGDNVLNLLLSDPKSVTAIDMSPAQIALLELKIAGIKTLDHSDFAILVGAQHGDALAAYDSARGSLDEVTRGYWDKRRDDIATGLMMSGRLERYISRFQRDHLSMVWSHDLIENLLSSPDLSAQRWLFAEEANTDEFRERFEAYFGRENMAAMGRDPAQFEHVDEGDVGGYFRKRFTWVCTQLSLPGNPYIEAFLTGAFRDMWFAPPYLKAEHFETLRQRVDRITLVVDEVERHLHECDAGRYNKANLSDIFEYMSEELADRVFGALADRLRSGGRIAYWNLLVPRAPSEKLGDKLTALSELSDKLWRQDRSWFYRAFRVDEVI
jgi:S-adenosylmethionine-diacylglycerol 3-amino-3-carboxypropyl transferase